MDMGSRVHKHLVGLLASVIEAVLLSVTEAVLDLLLLLLLRLLLLLIPLQLSERELKIQIQIISKDVRRHPSPRSPLAAKPHIADMRY